MDELTEADFEALVSGSDYYNLNGGIFLYTAYRKAVGNIAYNGEKIPEWDKLKWRAKWGWVSAYKEARELGCNSI